MAKYITLSKKGEESLLGRGLSGQTNTYVGPNITSGLQNQSLYEDYLSRKQSTTTAPTIKTTATANLTEKARPDNSFVGPMPGEQVKFSPLKLAAGALEKGYYQAGQQLSSGLSFLENKALNALDTFMPGIGTSYDQKDNSRGIFEPIKDKIESDLNKSAKKYEANVQAGGKVAQTIDRIGTSVASTAISMVPDAIMAFSTAGGSLAGSAATKGLEATAKAAQSAPRLASTLRTAVSSVSKDPQYWLSFLRVVGNSYDDAKKDGASETKATLYALSNSLLNAAVEVGGGVQTLPEELRGGKAAIKSWVDGMIDEGKEEVAQGIIERAMQNIVYNRGNALASVSDSDAIFNPATAAQEFAGGAIAGGILGGGQVLANAAIDSALNRSATQNKKSQTSDTKLTNDTAVTLFVEQGMNLKTAQKRADIISRLISGGSVSDREISLLEPTNQKTQEIFTQLTGVPFAENINRNRDELFATYRRAKDIQGIAQEAQQEAVQRAKDALSLPEEDITPEQRKASEERENRIGQDFDAMPEADTIEDQQKAEAADGPQSFEAYQAMNPEMVARANQAAAQQMGQLDKNGNPLMTRQQAAEYVRAQGYNPTPEELNQIYNAYMADNVTVTWQGQRYNYNTFRDMVNQTAQAAGQQIDESQIPLMFQGMLDQQFADGQDAATRFQNSTIPQQETVQQAPKFQSVEKVQDALGRGNRVAQDRISNEQFAELSERSDIAMDAKDRVYQVKSEEHIDNRTNQSVSNRSVNAFQFDHPELQQYYKEAAEVLGYKLDHVFPGGQIITKTNENTGGQFSYRMKRQAAEEINKLLDEAGLSYEQIGKGLEAILNDHGMENNAVAKRVELVLDQMLTYGYDGPEGYVGPNEDYIRAKSQIPGYKEPPTERTIPEELLEKRRTSRTVKNDRGVLNDRTMNDSSAANRWDASRTKGNQAETMYPGDIVNKIRHDFDIQVTKGYVENRKASGQYNTRNNGIRLRESNNLPTLHHELGHSIDAKYNLTESYDGSTKPKLSKASIKELVDNLDPDFASNYAAEQLPQEGLAEFMRQYLRNKDETTLNYPKFTKELFTTLSGKDIAMLQENADIANAYFSAENRNVTRRLNDPVKDWRTPFEKIRDIRDDLYQVVFDTNNAIKRFSESIGNEKTDKFGADVYKLATNAAYSDAMAGQIITGNLTDANGQYVGPGLKTVLNGIDTKNDQEWNDFGDYLVYRHGPERLAEGMRVFANDGENTVEYMNARAKDLEAKYPEFEKAADRLDAYISEFLKTWGVDTGLVSSDTAAQWAERWKHYVPFNRVMDNGPNKGGARRGFANQNSTIKRAKGSGRDIIHPVESFMGNIVKMVNAGIRNNVMQAITEYADKFEADAKFMEQVNEQSVKKTDISGLKAKLESQIAESGIDEDSQETVLGIIEGLDDLLIQYGRGKAHGNIVTVMKDGKPQFWKINDPALLESLTSLSTPKVKGILDAYGRVSKFMTQNITGDNVIWSITRNAPIDLGTFFSYSDVKNPLRVFPSIGSTYLNQFKSHMESSDVDPLYQEYLAMGGGDTSVYASDRDLADDAIKKIRGDKSYNPLDYIELLSSTVEMGPRFATYKMARENGATPQEAFYAAMDITVNFRRSGRIGRELNKVFPFINANIQGVDKFVRYYTGADVKRSERAQAVRNRFVGILAVSAAAAALSYALNETDDEKKKQYERLSTYTKNNFMLIPLDDDGHYFAIPKPRENFVLESLMETIMERTGGNEHAFDDFYQYAVGQLLPTIASDIAQFPVDVAKEGVQDALVNAGAGIIGSAGLLGTGFYAIANRDFLGRPVVSQSLQNLPYEEQYDQKTSQMAYWLGQAFGVSPKATDFVAESILGGLWKYPRYLLPVGSENRDLTLGVKSQWFKDSQYSQDLTNRMYLKSDESTLAARNGDVASQVIAKEDTLVKTAWTNYSNLSKNEKETDDTRELRGEMLDMIQGYLDESERGERSETRQAILDACVEAGTTDKMLPTARQKTISSNGEKYELTAKQYVEYQTYYLDQYYRIVERGLATSADKKAFLQTAVSTAGDAAKDHMMIVLGAGSSSYGDKYGDIDPAYVTEAKVRTREVSLENDGNTNISQKEAAEAVSSIESLTDEERAILWQSINSSWKTKNNPWRYALPDNYS